MLEQEVGYSISQDGEDYLLLKSDTEDLKTYIELHKTGDIRLSTVVINTIEPVILDLSKITDEEIERFLDKFND